MKIIKKLKGKMQFKKQDNIYTVTRITGNWDNILGVSFVDTDSTKDKIKVIQWIFPTIDSSTIRTSKEEVLNQVLVGFKDMNKYLGTNYTLAKIYYIPSEKGSELIYRRLTRHLLEHYYEGKEFKETKYHFSSRILP